MLTFVLSLVSSGSQNVYHCSRKHIQTLQNLESQAREYPHHSSFLKNKQKTFLEGLRSFLLYHWPELYHVYIISCNHWGVE